MKWILGALALLVIGLVLKLSLLVYAMYALLGVLWLSRFFANAWIEGIAAQRTCDRQEVEIGETAAVRVEIENRGRISVPWMILEESLPREALTQMPRRIKASGTRLELTRLRAGESKCLNYTVTFLMRGYYQLGPLLLETGDVFGLHRRFLVATNPEFVSVMPKVLPLEGYNLASRRPIGEIRIAHRLFEDPTRLATIRPYEKGDPLNRIHWRATARTGELHSRVYESSRVAGASFMLDFHELSYPGNAAATSAELAITTVASLANAVYLMGEQMGLITNGRDAAERIRQEGWTAEFTTRSGAHRSAAMAPKSDRLQPLIVETRKGAEQFRRIVESLARLEHTDGFTFAKLIEETASKLRRDATVVPVLREVSPESAFALGNLVRRGFLVTAIVVTFEEWTTPDWARPPDWAGMLLAQGVDFKVVNSEESVTQLCAASIVR